VRCEVPHDCGHPGAATEPILVDVSGGTTLGALASYSCLAPYLLSGVATRTCTATGWSGAEPTCVEPPPRCETDTCSGHGTCFEVSGQFDHCECQDGWTGTFCENLVNCGTIANTDPNLYITYIPGPAGSDTGYGAIAQHVCATGYNLVGVADRTCGPSGDWSGSAPICSPVDCGPPPATAPLVVSAPSGTTFGMTATYSCETGYGLVGDAQAICQASASWSGARSCALIDCGTYTPTDPNILVNNPTQTYYGAIADLTCGAGYSESGGTEITCGLDGGGEGAWLGVEPSCVLVTCDASDLPGILNGSVSVGGCGPEGEIVPGDEALYVCDPGWDLNADPADPVRCQTDGAWGGQVPSCQEGLCPLLSAPVNGTVSQPDRYLGGVASYGCDTGYYLALSGVPLSEPTYERSCTLSGDDLLWSGQAPTCEPRDCGAPPPVAHAAAPSFTSTTYGSTATYSCLDGYDMDGGATITCSAAGTWTATPACEPRDCGPPPAAGEYANLDPYSDTTYGAVVTYQCDGGYVPISGSPTSVSCLATGAWSPAVGLACEPAPLTCAPNPCEHGSCVESGGVFDHCICDPGWLGDMCNQPVDCGAPPPAGEFASLVGVTGTTLGHTATYACQIGYAPSAGGEAITCTASGAWSPAPLVCAPVSCGPAPAIGEGTTVTNPQAEYFYLQTVEYACELGYEASSGDASQLCEADGAWGGATLACALDPDFCPEPPTPAPSSHALLQSSTGRFLGATSDYVCELGYVPAPGYAEPTTLVCAVDGGGGVWQGTSLGCVPVDCGVPPAAPDNGSRSYTSTTLGSTVTYSCDPGYDVEGAASLLCEASGLWSGSAPVCTPVDCGAPPALNGPDSVLVSSTGTTYLSTATYACATGYTGGGASLTCGADGAWAGPATTCSIVTCPPDPAAALGPGVQRTDGGGNTYGTVATFACDGSTGFEWASGSGSTQTCEADGTWQGNVACQLHDCGPPPAGTLSSLSYMATTFGATASYSCLVGHDPVPPQADPLEASCTMSGWEPAPLVCAPVDCGQPAPAPPNGSLTVGQTTYGSTATYACDSGFDLVGTAEVACLETGLWSGGAPSCVPQEPVYCDVLYRLNGQFRVSDAPQTCGDTTTSATLNNANPSLSGGATTPFTITSEFRRAFMRLRFPASGGEPVAGNVSLVEYYLPIEFMVDCTGADVTTNVDHSVGLLGMTGTPPTIPVSPSLSRPCTAWGTGVLAGTTLDWSACTVIPFASGNAWSHDDAQAEAGDTTTACAMRMSVWGSVTCDGWACGFVPGRGNQRATWDQLLLNFTFSGTDYRTATFTMPEVQAPESTSETETRVWVAITLATPEHVECGTASELTCDEEAAP
jgi:CUB/sushi domain-containing protein